MTYQVEVLKKQRDVFSKKFAEGLRQMRVDEKLSEKYSTTADFVNEMQKYFKIASVCNKDNLTSCFPTESFTYQDNITDLTFTTSNLKTTQDIASVTGHDLGYEADVMGVVLSDGAQILIAVNPDCEGISGGDTQGNLYSCFKYIADVNGKKSPSSVGKDIVSNINMAALDFEIASTGSVASGTYGRVNGDYWLGAKNYCESLTENGGGWHLPSEEQLKQIEDNLYKNSEVCSCTTRSNGHYRCLDSNRSTCNWEQLSTLPLWSQIGGSYNGVYFVWLNVRDDSNGSAYIIMFSGTGSDIGADYVVNSSSRALCVR